MASWYYYDKNGNKVGPIRSRELKQLVQLGVVKPETLLEDSEGRVGLAGNAKGIEFPLPSAASLPPPPVPSKTMFFYTDANGQKQGPVNDQQLEVLVTRGVIKPNTPLETGTGHKGLAGQISDLFPASVSLPIPPMEPAPNVPLIFPPQKSIQNIRNEVQTLRVTTVKSLAELATIRQGIIILSILLGCPILFVMLSVAGKILF